MRERVDQLVSNFDLTGFFEREGFGLFDEALNEGVKEGIYQAYRLYRTEIKISGQKYVLSYQVLTFPDGNIAASVVFSEPKRDVDEPLAWRLFRFKRKMNLFTRSVRWLLADEDFVIKTKDKSARHLSERFFDTELAHAYNLILADLRQNELEGEKFVALWFE